MSNNYKLTKLGYFPENWEVTEANYLGLEFIDGDRGTNYPKETDFSKEGYCLFLNAKNVTKEGFKFNECQFISADKDSQLRKGKLNRNDIIITTRGSVGNVALFNESVSYNNVRLNSGMVILRDSNNKFNTSFLYHFLKSSLFQKQVDNISFGSAQPQLTITELKKLKVIAPPIIEQKIIAALLTTVDEKIELIARQIFQFENLKTSLTQQFFTKGIGHKNLKSSELGDIPINWDIKYINEIAKISTGAKDTQNKVDSGAYPFVVRSQKLERINSYSFDGEAILTAGDGVGVGKVFHYLNEKFDYHQRVYNIHDFKSAISGKYFFEYFKNNFHKQVRRYNAKGSVDSVRMDMIAKMFIPIPPINEQNKITHILNTVDDKLDILISKKNHYQDFKIGLMQQLLTGKIRVNTYQQQSAVA